MDQKLPQKKVKASQEPSIEIPQQVVVQLIDNRSQSLGTFHLDTTTSPQELQTLLLSLLPPEEHQPFNFFHQQRQIKNALATFFQQISYSRFEDTLEIVCHPASTFRVRPVTRASSSLYGHSEAVLSLQFSPDATQLASGSGDGSLRLWDLSTQTPLK